MPRPATSTSTSHTSEPSLPGVVVRDLQGRRVGVRYGITIIVNPAKPEW